MHASGVTSSPGRASVGCSDAGPTSPTSMPSSRAQAWRTAASGTIRVEPSTTPSKTAPVEPSMVMTSPSRRLLPATISCPSRTSTAVAPTTAGIPHPRATTAAWLASPPRDVRIPTAFAMPWTSSGEVSARTRTARRPCSAACTAASGDVAIGPLARPGEAGRPLANASGRSARAIAILGGFARSGRTLATASVRVRGNEGSSAMSAAIRSAACGLRFPTRTWSIHRRPSSIVNSISQRSAWWRSSRSA